MDFKSVISEALASGVSIDEVMSAFAEAANEIEQEKKAAESKSDRDKVLETLDKTFWAQVKTGTLSNSDAAALVTLVVAHDTTIGKEMSAEDIIDFLQYADFVLKHIEESWKIGRNAVSMLNKHFGVDLDDLFNKSENESKSCGTDREACHCKTPESGDTEGFISAFKPTAEIKVHGPFDPADAEKIKNFLSSLLSE